jgi:hypothetical protein
MVEFDLLHVINRGNSLSNLMLRTHHAETSTERSSTKRQIADFLGHSALALRNISYLTLS